MRVKFLLDRIFSISLRIFPGIIESIIEKFIRFNMMEIFALFWLHSNIFVCQLSKTLSILKKKWSFNLCHIHNRLNYNFVQATVSRDTMSTFDYRNKKDTYVMFRSA